MMSAQMRGRAFPVDNEFSSLPLTSCSSICDIMRDIVYELMPSFSVDLKNGWILLVQCIMLPVHHA